MFVKWFVPEHFRKERFAEMLEREMNVRAMPVDGGIVFDKTAFNDNLEIIKRLPDWIKVNLKDLTNPLRSRPATPEEVIAAGVQWRYTAISACPAYSMAVLKAENLLELIQQVNNMSAKEGERILIVDNYTGEVVHEK